MSELTLSLASAARQDVVTTLRIGLSGDRASLVAWARKMARQTDYQKNADLAGAIRALLTPAERVGSPLRRGNEEMGDG